MRAFPIVRLRAVLPRIAMLLVLGACRADTQSSALDPAPAAPPVMALSVTDADFAAMLHGLAPIRTVAISNAGGGALGGLGIGAITYYGDDRGWLTASLSATTAPATLTLQAAAGNLAAGTYYAALSLVATGAANSPRKVSVSFRVDAPAVAPIIGLSAVSVALSAVTGSLGTAQQVLVLPASDVPLTGLAISDVTYEASNSGWLQASLLDTSAPTALVLTPDARGLPTGSYVAIVTVSAPGAINSPRSIRVGLTVTAAPVPPTIALAPANLAFSGTTGAASPAAKTVAITNGGGGTLSGLSLSAASYTGSAGGWLAASLNTTTAPATLTLTPQTGSLAAGSYGATLQVLAAGASNTPQTVTVSLTVTSAPVPPAIGLSSASAGFVASVGGSAPSPTTVTISNSGGGTLSGLAVGTTTYGAGGSGWLTATLSSGTAPASLTLSAAPGALGAGTYTAMVPVTSAAAANSPQVVSVTLTMSAVPVPAAIALAPASLTFSGTAGGTLPAAKTATVSNSGGGTLSGLAVGTITYGAGGTGWLAASLNSATAPATLTITPTLGALAAGTYTATVPVTSAGASNSPQNVAVTFTVAAAGGTVSFATDIYPTFQTNCLSAGCHIPGGQAPNLSTVSAAYTNLVSATTKYVTPGDSTKGLLLGVLQGTTGPLMPPSGKLSAAFITKVKSWIAQGAKNN